MKMPEKQRKYCPKCDKHTEHKVKKESSGGKRGALSQGERRSKRRLKGYGNSGKSSEAPSGEKPTKRTNLQYECQECGNKQTIGKGFRVKKLELER
ncbi:MAG: 50S ribosomal protein L44e [Candidatus Aenigmatarchaeota archaeon]